jgi:hypothetical protein
MKLQMTLLLLTLLSNISWASDPLPNTELNKACGLAGLTLDQACGLSIKDVQVEINRNTLIVLTNRGPEFIEALMNGLMNNAMDHLLMLELNNSGGIDQAQIEINKNVLTVMSNDSEITKEILNKVFQDASDPVKLDKMYQEGLQYSQLFKPAKDPQMDLILSHLKRLAEQLDRENSEYAERHFYPMWMHKGR